MDNTSNNSKEKNNKFFQKSLFKNEDRVIHDINRKIDDSERDEILTTLLAISSINGIGFKTLREMKSKGFLRNFWKMSKSEIEQGWDLLEVKPRKNFSRELFEKRAELEKYGDSSAKKLTTKGVTFVPLGHIDYPASLLKLDNPPQWVFAKGNTEILLSKSIIGVVGTRDLTKTGERTAYNCAKELVVRNIVVLSGMARGIDEKAHQAAVDFYGQTIAILGHGLTKKFVSDNNSLWERILETGGVIISEYLPTSPPSRDRYLRRNKLQAAMSRVLIPVECPSMKSGTGATIRRAISINTPVIGIIPAGTNSESMLMTKRNLEDLDFPVFEVFSDNSKEFWRYLEEKLPDHDWVPNHIARQGRFFKKIEKIILDSYERLSMDSSSIDRFTEQLKNLLGEENE